MLTAPVHPTPWDPRSRQADGLRIRPATPDDVVELAALKRRVERQCYAHLGTAEALSVRLHRRCTGWYLLGRLAAGELVLTAEHDGRPVGLGVARVDRVGGRPQLHLHSTYVERRGLRAGKALTVSRLEAADRLGLQVVTADCFVGATAAAARLRALGLEEVSRTASPTFPGVGLSHWAGSLHTALDRAGAVPSPRPAPPADLTHQHNCT
ncbi:MAG: hypothetical protein JWN87_2724 [Frankiales bacterium]|nr:hypothetical protein [Frankiales bacterium]